MQTKYILLFLYALYPKGRGLRRRERVVLQNVSEELETANKYSSRHCATSKLRNPTKNSRRDGSFFISSPVRHGYGRIRQRHAVVEKHRERGNCETKFVLYVLPRYTIYGCYMLITGICGNYQLVYIILLLKSVNISGQLETTVATLSFAIKSFTEIPAKPVVARRATDSCILNNRWHFEISIVIKMNEQF